MGEWWIVVEYDRVDARGMQDGGPVYVPGELGNATLVYLDDSATPNEERAIDAIATRGGHYAAFPVPQGISPRKVEMKVLDA